LVQHRAHGRLVRAGGRGKESGRRSRSTPNPLGAAVCSANENASSSISVSNSPIPDHEQQVPVPEPSHMESSLLAGVSALAAASRYQH